MRKLKLISVQNENLLVLEKIHSNNCRTVVVLIKKKLLE